LLGQPMVEGTASLIVWDALRGVFDGLGFDAVGDEAFTSLVPADGQHLARPVSVRQPRRGRLGRHLARRVVPAEPTGTRRHDRQRVGVDDDVLRRAARCRLVLCAVFDHRVRRSGFTLRAEGRLPSVRAGILPALPAGRAVTADSRHIYDPHRVPLRRGYLKQLHGLLDLSVPSCATRAGVRFACSISTELMRSCLTHGAYLRRHAISAVRPSYVRSRRAARRTCSMMSSSLTVPPRTARRRSAASSSSGASRSEP